MPLPASFITQTLNDNTLKSNGEPETTTYRLAITTLTPANAAAQVTLVGNLNAAVAGITLGVFGKSSIVYSEAAGSNAAAASPLAQRENKWLVRYHDDTTNQKMTASVGTADLSLLTNNSEFLDLSGTEGAAFVTAFEAVVMSNYDATHTVTVDTVQFVGRNS